MNLVRVQRSATLISCILGRSKMTSANTQEAYTVKHDVEKMRFYVELDEDDNAVLDYAYLNNQTVDLFHTEVPPSMQGKGIAQLLAKAALNYVATNNLKMKLSCWYLQGYVTKNPLPEYTSRVVTE